MKSNVTILSNIGTTTQFYRLNSYIITYLKAFSINVFHKLCLSWARIGCFRKGRIRI